MWVFSIATWNHQRVSGFQVVSLRWSQLTTLDVPFCFHGIFQCSSHFPWRSLCLANPKTTTSPAQAPCHGAAAVVDPHGCFSTGGMSPWHSGAGGKISPEMGRCWVNQQERLIKLKGSSVKLGNLDQLIGLCWVSWLLVTNMDPAIVVVKIRGQNQGITPSIFDGYPPVNQHSYRNGQSSSKIYETCWFPYQTVSVPEGKPSNLWIKSARIHSSQIGKKNPCSMFKPCQNPCFVHPETRQNGSTTSGLRRRWPCPDFDARKRLPQRSVRAGG